MSLPETHKIAFRMHPRVFAALGADLVTNDVVAVIELVKNSYDALATRVDLRFRTTEEGLVLEIEDNGTGMPRSIIDDVWCVVATPYRLNHPTTGKGAKKRRASGEKGLGRLSAARLGGRLEMLTQAKGEPCWKVTVDWSSLASANRMETCHAIRERYSEPSPFSESGTALRIYGLRSKWDETKFDDLRDNLSRLVSPFKKIEDFAIYFTPPGKQASAIEIEPPEFLSHPPYLIRGGFTGEGMLVCRYNYSPNVGKKRSSERKYRWKALREELSAEEWTEIELPPCGPFNFQVRAWDIGGEDVAGIAERFQLQRASVRQSIKAFKGISLYRDGILVLPKTESARDWLGLDLRRVSRTGTRLSTSQIVGYAAISAEENPHIEDTSDRERLVNTPEVALFEELLKYIVAVLETERERDRREARPAEQPLKDLFAELSPTKLIADVDEVINEGGTASDTMPLVVDFGRRLEQAKDQIEHRFVYYSRLATVGTIAQMLVHEVGNKTMVVGKFLVSVKDALKAGSLKGEPMQRQLELAERAVDSLTQLSDRFSPLASRSFRRGKRDCVLEEVIRECMEMRAGYVAKMEIQTTWPDSETRVAVDPGELFPIVLNLLDNSLYWVVQPEAKKRRIQFAIHGERERVIVEIHDSGPGVSEEDEEKIFLPGVTRKPNGIGMGLTVASELVAEYGGRLHLIRPGDLGGASFGFDLPKSSS